MTNPYRAMCSHPLAQEAYVAFVQICKGGSDDAGTYDADEEIVRRALKRLDELEGALLAQPEPEGPTDEELLDLADWEVWDHQLLAFARAAIARHGRPTPQPVAVSERLDWRRPNALPTPEATNDPRPPASSLPN